MMRVRSLLKSTIGARGGIPSLEVNPLRDVNALVETQLLDVRIDALRQSAGLLFETRMGLQLRQSDAAVMVGHGIRELEWVSEVRPLDLAVWTVFGSIPIAGDDGDFTVEILMGAVPGARLRMVCEQAAFYAIDVPGLGVAPPDYGDGDTAQVAAGLPGWDSRFKLVGAEFWSADGPVKFSV